MNPEVCGRPKEGVLAKKKVQKLLLEARVHNGALHLTPSDSRVIISNCNHIKYIFKTIRIFLSATYAGSDFFEGINKK